MNVLKWMFSNAVFSSIQRLYREKGENLKHNYTVSEEMPEFVQAKLNAMNISEVKPRSQEHTYSGNMKSINPFNQ